MKSLHIRDVEPGVLKRLQILARMHHRSMQGELRAILEEAARRAPDPAEADPDALITVTVASQGSWRREDMYGDDAR